MTALSPPGGAMIALLGLDGCGKTTQARRLVAWLESGHHPAAYFRNEAGRSDLDAAARRHGWSDFADMIGADSAAWAQTVVRWKSIRAAVGGDLPRGTVRVMDRYTYCQYAAARMYGLPDGPVRALFGDFPAPDLALYLDVPPALAVERVRRRGVDEDGLDLLTALDAGYRSLPEFGTFTVVDGGADPDAVQHAIRSAVAALLGP